MVVKNHIFLKIGGKISPKAAEENKSIFDNI
jgi:hypothetical protein